MVLAPGLGDALGSLDFSSALPSVMPPHDAPAESGEGLRRPLETILLGVIARLEPSGASDAAAITAAFRESIALGEAYAREGRAASGLIQAYLSVRDRLARLLPPTVPADAPGVPEWRARLERAVDNFLKVALQAFERQRVAEWDRLAHVDGATRLYNRGYFERRFLDEIRRADRYHHPLTLLVADTTLAEPSEAGGGQGPSPRERLVRLGARALECVLRDVDLVMCYRGQELVALLPDTPLVGGRVAAERALQTARDEAAAFGLDPDAVSLAIGLATYPDHGADAWSVLAAADHALYRARRSGCGLALA